ncbi:hypothetical protein A3I56_04460 [Candidatus Roizmanbacteria bacterium RIFCSPLOWO2_02_FULL_43_10]|nr:MAG: hypothetical protein A3I56_04460 [Candidatus Roizmanbacteria bacterium RIFCSPLOWO2_02_FULL_43_10]
MNHYAYLSTKLGKYVFPLDDSRFTNHSSTRNNVDSVQLPGESELVGIANSDIERGEEILVNYRDFDVRDKNSQEEYLRT